MDLTSLRRVKYALAVSNTAQDHILARLVPAASKQIVRWLRREDQARGNGLQLKSRIEYLDPQPGERTFYPSAYPITSIISISSDGYGQYSGSEQSVDSSWFLIGSDSRSFSFIIIPQIPNWSGFPTVPRGMRLTYTAGLAADPVLSNWTKTAESGGTFTVNNYIQGADSLAIGRITARAAGTMSYECLSGVFLAGETVKEYASLHSAQQGPGLSATTDVAAVLTACTSQSLAESDPALSMACEMHIAHLKRNMDGLENKITSTEGDHRFTGPEMAGRGGILPEILELLKPYRNNLVVA